MRGTVLRRKLLRDVRRQRAQFLAIALTVFLGVTLFGGSRDAYRSLVASYDALFERLSFADRWIVGGDAARAAAGAGDLDGVEAAALRHQADLPIRVGGSGLDGRLVGVPLGRQPAVNALHLEEGTLPDRRGEVLADRRLAEAFDLAPGDTVVVAGPGGRATATLSGVATSVEYLWLARDRQDVLPSPRDFGVLYVPDADVVAWAGPLAVPQVVVRYAPGAAPSTDRAVTALATAAGAVDTFDRAAQPSNEALQQDVRGFGDFAFMFPVLFLGAAGLGASVVLTRMVTAQRATIGMLAASGAPRRAVFRHYMGYGLAAGLIGGVPGAAAGVLLAWLVAGFYTRLLGVPGTVLEVGGTTPLLGVAFAVAAGTLAALLPARRAARIAPAEAMRGIVPVHGGGASAVERALPFLRRLPVSATYVIRAAFRSPRRALTTGLGVVLSLVLVLVSGGMLDTVDHMLDRQFGVVQREDAQVAYDASRSGLAALREVAGVAAVEPVVHVPVVLESGGRRYATILDGFRPGTEMHAFLAPGGGEIDLPAEGILAGEDLRGSLGVDVGDTVTVRVPAAGVVADMTLAGFVDEPMGTLAYTSLPAAERLLGPAGTAGPATALVRYEPGVDRRAVEDLLEAQPGVVAVVDSRGLLETFRDFVGLFYGMVGMMLLFGALLAFALIFNAMSVNISERTVELATLRAAGVTTRRLGRIITAENLTVTLLAIGPGVVLGLLAASAFLGAYDTDQFTLELHVRWWTPAAAAAGMVLVALLSQWPGLRAVDRLDVAGVVRERAV